MSIIKYTCACPLDCFDVCSLSITVENGKVINIDGNKEHPITNGFICKKGKRHLDRLYSLTRLKYPMKKIDNEWYQITWDEAYETISGKLNQYIKEHGTKSIAHYYYSGAAGMLKGIENLFFEYLGDITIFDGDLCWGAGMNAQKKDFGAVFSHSPVDIQNSKLIVIWGKNPADTNIHLMPYLKKAKENGAKIILIDPVKTATASYCDAHIQPIPGGDCALACAIVKYIIENDTYDKEYVDGYTKGFKELKGYIENLTMEELASKSGMKISEIINLAQIIANNKPMAIHIGYGIQRYLFGGTTIRIIDALAAITGNIGLSGGGANYANKILEDIIDWVKFKPNRTVNPRIIERISFGKAIKQANKPMVKAIFITRANPVTQLPNTNEVIEAINSIDFKVVIDHFMTDTARLADIVLPCTYFLEEEDLITSGMWNSFIHYNKKCVKPYYETKSEYDIFTDLAKRMSIESFPIFSENEWIKMLVEPLIEKGLDMKTLEEKFYVESPVRYDIPWKDKKFLTASGKFEIIEVNQLKTYFEQEADKSIENKYRLLTVHARESLHSQHFLHNNDSYPTVYINTADAMEMSIKSDDIIILYNEYGELRVKAIITDDCRTKVMYIKEGWGLKQGGSVNLLTPDLVSDIGKQAVYNECMCSIKKV